MSRLDAWRLALRVRTWPAAVVPVVVGTGAAARHERADLPIALVALAAALLIQIGTNLVNDWGDHRRGADGADRLGPRRVGAPGLLTPAAAGAGGAVAFAAAALLGLVLIAHRGWAAAAIGAAAIAAGAGYTAGPWPLAYHALGEVFVLVFFGPVAVCGTEWVQAGRVSAAALGASLPVGLLATAILLVNNVRDLESDRRAGKRTLAVRLGRPVARGLYMGAVAAAFVAATGLALAADAPAVLLVWLAVPLAIPPLRAVRSHTDGPRLNAALAGTARLHLAFGLVLGGALAW